MLRSSIICNARQKPIMRLHCFQMPTGSFCSRATLLLVSYSQFSHCRSSLKLAGRLLRATTSAFRRNASFVHEASAFASKNSPAQLSFTKPNWNLNEEQQQAVETQESYVRVVAGPGSGKTRVLVCRIVFMVKYLHVPPSQILCITFTNKAANELRMRLDSMLGHEVSRHIKVGTVHSICAKILRSSDEISDYHLHHSYVIYDEEDSKKLVKNIFEEACRGTGMNNLPEKIGHFNCNQYLVQGQATRSGTEITDYHTIRAMKIQRIRPELLRILGKHTNSKTTEEKRFIISAGAVDNLHGLITRARLFNVHQFIARSNKQAMSSRSIFREFVFEAADIYEHDLRKANAVDFDDLLSLVACLFHKYPDMLKEYQDAWRHVLVDEFQDIDVIQYELIRLLSSGNESLFVVGDADQAIYEWRGAEAAHMQYSLLKDFPKIATFQLVRNYRSTDNILKVASAVLGSSPRALKMKSRVTNLISMKGSGTYVFIKSLAGKVEEGNYIASEIKKLSQSTFTSWDKFAILYRTHLQSYLIEVGLRKLGVPVVTTGSKPFWSYKEIKCVLSYLHFIANAENQVALENIINVPNRGIGPKTVRRIKDWVSHSHISFSAGLKYICTDTVISREVKLTSTMRTALQKFWKLVEDLRTVSEQCTVGDIIKLVIGRTELKAYLKRMYQNDDSYQTRLNRLSILQSLASARSQEKGKAALVTFLQDFALESCQEDNHKECVQLMTLHAAKGLEFDCVFICGLEEGVLPLNHQNVQEERRLFYVGATRAMERLYLTFSYSKTGKGPLEAKPSRFIQDILTHPGLQGSVEVIQDDVYDV